MSEKGPGPNKRSSIRHAIRHPAVRRKLRLGRFTGTLFWLLSGFICLLLVHRVFLQFSGTSVLSGFFEPLGQSVIARLGITSLVGYVFYQVAVAIGEARVSAPFDRFVKHLQTVTRDGGEKFVLRRGDVHFVPVAVAFNQMINRIKKKGPRS